MKQFTYYIKSLEPIFARDFIEDVFDEYRKKRGFEFVRSDDRIKAFLYFQNHYKDEYRVGPNYKRERKPPFKKYVARWYFRLPSTITAYGGKNSKGFHVVNDAINFKEIRRMLEKALGPLEECKACYQGITIDHKEHLKKKRGY